jgi:antitoxin ParD1/3/4
MMRPMAKFAIRCYLDLVPTRNISLTAEQDAFVARIVKAGEYQNASEALRDALRALQQRREEDALKLEVLKAQVQRGIAALDHGKSTDLDDDELDGFLSKLGKRSRRRKR